MPTILIDYCRPTRAEHAVRTLEEIAAGGEKTVRELTAAVNAARRSASATAEDRHSGLPEVWVAGKVLVGVTCIRLYVNR